LIIFKALICPLVTNLESLKQNQNDRDHQETQKISYDAELSRVRDEKKQLEEELHRAVTEKTQLQAELHELPPEQSSIDEVRVSLREIEMEERGI
jgi:predicted nuclease with TOPRIM domain